MWLFLNLIITSIHPFYFLASFSHVQVLVLVFVFHLVSSVCYSHSGSTYKTNGSVFYTCKQIFHLPLVQKDPFFLPFFSPFFRRGSVVPVLAEGCYDYCVLPCASFLVVGKQQIGALSPTDVECGLSCQNATKTERTSASSHLVRLCGPEFDTYDLPPENAELVVWSKVVSKTA